MTADPRRPLLTRDLGRQKGGRGWRRKDMPRASLSPGETVSALLGGAPAGIGSSSGSSGLSDSSSNDDCGGRGEPPVDAKATWDAILSASGYERISPIQIQVLQGYHGRDVLAIAAQVYRTAFRGDMTDHIRVLPTHLRCVHAAWLFRQRRQGHRSRRSGASTVRLFPRPSRLSGNTGLPRTRLITLMSSTSD